MSEGAGETTELRGTPPDGTGDGLRRLAAVSMAGRVLLDTRCVSGMVSGLEGRTGDRSSGMVSGLEGRTGDELDDLCRKARFIPWKTLTTHCSAAVEKAAGGCRVSCLIELSMVRFSVQTGFVENSQELTNSTCTCAGGIAPTCRAAFWVLLYHAWFAPGRRNTLTRMRPHHQLQGGPPPPLRELGWALGESALFFSH